MDKTFVMHLLDGMKNMVADFAEAAERGDSQAMLHLLDGLKMVVKDLEEAIGEGETGQE